MEYTPEISSALDIYSEETVAADESGRVLHVFSENRTVQNLLEELFYDTLNVEFNLTPWARNLVKYGDFFLFNDVDPKYGVINAYPMPISEVEREEGYDPKDPMAVRFRWITQGNQPLENCQVCHMRLMGNDAFLPYGSSVLESARRIWRQLILIEDAMLVGGAIWRTHPFGYLLRRTEGEHTWEIDDRYFLRHADQKWDGKAFETADVISDV